MKTCSKCKETKPLSEFYKNRSTKDGLQAYCKICQSKYQAKYQKMYSQTERGRTAHKRAMARYLKTDKGAILTKARSRQYIQTEHGRTTRKRYSQSKKGKSIQKIAQKHYRMGHLERRKAVEAIRYAIITGKLCRPDSLQCCYCPKQAKEYHHHKGYAPEHWLYVQPVCRDCHINIHWGVAI